MHLLFSDHDSDDDSQTQPSQHVFNFDYNLAHKNMSKQLPTTWLILCTKTMNSNLTLMGKRSYVFILVLVLYHNTR